MKDGLSHINVHWSSPIMAHNVTWKCVKYKELTASDAANMGGLWNKINWLLSL